MKVFTETQKFDQLWLWLLLIPSGLLPVVIFGAGLYVQLVKGQSFGNNPMSDQGLILAFILTLLLCLGLLLLFALTRLQTRVDKNSIELRFFPLLRKKRIISWNEVERFEVVKYNPVRDYGGWGLRFGKGGKAYNVRGDHGLKLWFYNGRHLLIGTSQPVLLGDFLRKLHEPPEGAQS